MSGAGTVQAAFSHYHYGELAGREITRFAELVAGADLSAGVPSCPRWKLRDLVHHTGAIHRWATSLVEDRATKRRRIADTDDWPPRASSMVASEWLLAGREPLLAALASAEPDTKMWAWGADQHVRFWS